MRYTAIILSCCVGFLSLSQEILWIRLVSFTHQTVPQAFAFVVGYFLVGIALGAEIGKRICTKSCDLLKASAWLLAIAAILDFSIPYIYAWACQHDANPSISTLLIFFSALCKSALFPIVHHLGSLGTRRGLGVSVSTIYFANIVGSTLGPLITGFVLLDYLKMQQAFALICIGDLVLVVFCLSILRNWMFAGIVTVTAVTLFMTIPPINLVAHVTEWRPKRIIENRHGIITVMEGGPRGDIVFGGNAYDGRITTNLKSNPYLIHRVYALAALQPNPKRILVIGLSGGTWTKILSGFQGVERIDVVEINPGYLELIRSYKEVSSILEDPKVHIVIDDGRRWLRRNPLEKYDLIVMNTTWHWRNYTSNLLSYEFIRQLQARMNRNGILAYNSTWSLDAFKTASEIFPHAYLYGNFIIAGDRDFRQDLKYGFDRIAAIKWAETPAFNLNNPEDTLAIQKVLDVPFNSFSILQKEAKRQYEVVTEQNMITEYKYGRGMY